MKSIDGHPGTELEATLTRGGERQRTPCPRLFNGTLATVKPWASPRLVAAADWSRLATLAEAVPAALADSFYLECHLGDSAPGTDLILGVGEAGRRILAGGNTSIALSRDLREHPVWSILGELCRRWQDQPGRLHRQMERIWLEFDLGGESERLGGVPIPGLFVDWRQPLDSADALVVAPMLLAQLQGLTGRPFEPELREALIERLQRLPEAISLYSIGFFPNRHGDQARLCFRGTEEQLCEYLGRLGPGSQALSQLATDGVSSLGSEPRQKRILHLDVGSSTVPQIGLERTLKHLGRRDLAGDAYLDDLVACGQCTAAQRQGLAAWPGGGVESFAHEIWQSLAVRWLNHVKVTTDHNATSRVKAYLCHRHVPHVRRRRAPS